MVLTICASCRDKELEPRWLVVMYGRKHGFESVRQVISANRYVGPAVLASELA